MIWSISRMQNKVLGKAILLVSWLIFLLFFTLGLLVIASSLKEIIFGFKPGFFPYLYILIGSIILHNTYKYFKTLRARKAPAAGIWMKSYIRSNKWPLTVSIIITAILLYNYYNVFFLKFGFIANLILFLPAFVLENLIFIAEVFLKRLVGSLIPEVYGILIPIAEFYYVYSIVGFIYKKVLQRRRKA